MSDVRDMDTYIYEYCTAKGKERLVKVKLRIVTRKPYFFKPDVPPQVKKTFSLLYH
jgi:hypothetical protein